MIADSTFLIDLQREVRHMGEGPATHFLRQHATVVFSISVVTVMEFEEGFEDVDLDTTRALLKAFPVIEIDLPVARRAARLRRCLRKSGNLFGDNDLLIAATVLQCDETLVTRNQEHFRRVAGLRMISY